MLVICQEEEAVDMVEDVTALAVPVNIMFVQSPVLLSFGPPLATSSLECRHGTIGKWSHSANLHMGIGAGKRTLV